MLQYRCLCGTVGDISHLNSIKLVLRIPKK
nr:MAG TPA: hypothetical protein [Caudoviricetes sp.]